MEYVFQVDTRQGSVGSEDGVEVEIAGADVLTLTPSAIGICRNTALS
jgi:hypothetical protein